MTKAILKFCAALISRSQAWFYKVTSNHGSLYVIKGKPLFCVLDLLVDLLDALCFIVNEISMPLLAYSFAYLLTSTMFKTGAREVGRW